MHHFYIGRNYRMVSISIPICRLLVFLRCKSLFAHVSPVGEHENVFPVILRRVYMYIDWSRLLPSMVFGHVDNSYNREAILHHYTIDPINNIIVGFLL